MTKAEFAEFIKDLLSPLGGVSAKRMFGGYGIYKNAIMFAIIADDMFYFKVTEENRSDFEENGCFPFSYEARGKTIKLSYWNAPEHLLEDSEELCKWAQRAYEAAKRAKK